MRECNAILRGTAVAAVAAVAGALACALPAHAAAPSTLSVTPQQVWTDTGIVVKHGDRVTITAGGHIHFGRAPIDSVGPRGVPQGPACAAVARTYGRATGWPAPALACWSLIARVDGGAPVEIGNGTTIEATRDGPLQLGVNDNVLTDNNGKWAVTVSVVASSRHSRGPITFLAVVAALIACAVLLVSIMRRRRTQSRHDIDALPADLHERSATAVSPEDANVNIFEVVLDDALRVRYSYFPADTQVRWRITSDHAPLEEGEFLAEGGPRPHDVTIPLARPLTPSARGEVAFMWNVGDASFVYSVTRERV